MKKVLLFPLCVLVLSSPSFAQDLRKVKGFAFTNEELAHYLHYKSRQQRTKAWVALVSGPAITATGLAVILKNQELSKSGQNFFFIAASAGLVTTISSVPLYISSVQNRKKARLLLKNEATTMVRPSRSFLLPAIGIGLSL
ncbi:hypothetical protein V9K67_11035 [Paraflavisolibacter sp. H34]|uniref:hypothetical protein n=1 Tax=Huijunlia imazamoxiresistens TaxID=3127457 RepID=UPI003015C90D